MFLRVLVAFLKHPVSLQKDSAENECASELPEFLRTSLSVCIGWILGAFPRQMCPRRFIAKDCKHELLAELDTTQTRRNLQVGTGNSSVGTTGNSSFTGTGNSSVGILVTHRLVLGCRLSFSAPFSCYFDIIFQCRGCPSDTPLLTNDAARYLFAIGPPSTGEGMSVSCGGGGCSPSFSRRLRCRL